MGKFNSTRLREARLYRKKTIEELATLIKISKQAISQFENRKAEPDFNTLHEISRVLRFPVQFFREEVTNNVVIGNTYFRAPFSSNKKDMNSQHYKAEYITFIHDCLTEYVDFPKLNIPHFAMTSDIEQIASRVRDFWGLGLEPIPDMISLLERNGIVVSELSTEVQAIDAFYQYTERSGKEYHCIVLGTDKNSFARRQFSAAHELAHILLHKQGDNYQELDRDEFKKIEYEAHKFASAFLLPKETFGLDVSAYANKLDFYVELKRKWKVSISAMIRRAFEIESISANQYQYLMRQMSSKGWRKKEPLDDYLILKKPKAIKQAINMLILNNYLTPKQIFQLFSEYGKSLPKNVVDEVLNLEPDILPDALYGETEEFIDTNIVKLFPRTRQN